MPWARKPPYSVPINPGHPLARDLRWALPFNELAGTRGVINRSAHETVDGLFGTGITWTGRGIKSDGTANGNVSLEAGNTAAWGGAMTVLVDFLATDYSALRSISSDDSSGGLEQNLSIYTSSPGHLAMVWNSVTVTTGLITLSTNTWYRSVCIRSGGTGAWTATIYTGLIDPAGMGANLVLDNSGTTATNPNGAADVTRIGRAGSFTGSAFWPGQIGLYLMWSRALSAAEALAAGQNPWQIWTDPIEPSRRFQASGGLVIPPTATVWLLKA